MKIRINLYDLKRKKEVNIIFLLYNTDKSKLKKKIIFYLKLKLNEVNLFVQLEKIKNSKELI